MKFCYADPPYLGNGKSKYDHPEWDKKDRHFSLILELDLQYPDGWALSCNPKDLSWLYPACPTARVCAWVKTFHQIRSNIATQFSWEPVLLKGGRPAPKGRKPMVRDWMACARAMKKGLKGAKPDKFNDWILKLLNFQKGDTLLDMFPGSNGMAAAIARAEGTKDLPEAIPEVRP
jgi:hypothetical protein